MDSRVKEVRKALGLTQTEFGKRLGVTDGAITLIEKGKRNLTEQMEKAICREFGVNPLWLHTGEGEPFRSEEGDLDKVIDMLMVDEKETAKAVFKALAKMGGNEWVVFRHAILSVAHEIEQSEQKKE
jgi:transcriptional regulator with XRE-family HTH domain